MTENRPDKRSALQAKSPFDLRVRLGMQVAETAVREALGHGDMGFLHSFTTGSAVDGPGMRVVAWTTGCMWRCQYCHNPDTWTMRNGIPVSVEQALEELAKYRNGLAVMSGGVTISGGEPLMQRPFVMKMLAGAKSMGVHTALETNGFLGAELTESDLEMLDLVLLGLKCWDPERHRALTGRDIDPTLALAQRLALRSLPVWIRFVLVPGLTDDARDIRQIARFVASLGNVERVDVLPFHQMGRFKWKALGIAYPLEATEPPSSDAHRAACEIFLAAGLNAH
ncbi:MAG TPA: pyruvate formate-lyase-activating protein [Gemmatimonadaceae bacterium]|nr:pyruvate formate-lyase-activating protein [Gemmatimonadaceae bacterium]